jgi:hypothetical protein
MSANDQADKRLLLTAPKAAQTFKMLYSLRKPIKKGQFETVHIGDRNLVVVQSLRKMVGAA